MLRNLGKFALGVAGAILMLYATPTAAQKSKNTVRTTFGQPISLVDQIHGAGGPASSVFYKVVFDSLVRYDWINGVYRPALAKSWKRLSPTTLELKLRDDIKFHDGSKFDADDVVYWIGYLIKPKYKFRFASSYSWIKTIEKVDAHTVRLISKKPFQPAMSRLENIPIYPSDVHSQTMLDFGKKPVGTGAYKVIQVDSSKGLIMVRNKDYKLGNKWWPGGKIDRVEIKPIPDKLTQQARMMVGDQDLMWDVPADQAQGLSVNPKFKLTVVDSLNFSYFQFDALDRGKTGLFKDQRVRRAVAHAIDRAAIQKALTPKEAHSFAVPSGMCHKLIRGCGYTVKPPAFDPAKAKRLLTEAGYPKGFDLQLNTWGSSKNIAEAVAGQLRAVGIRAKINFVTYGTYSKMRKSGKLLTLISQWSNARTPDIYSTMGFFFRPWSGDYMGDKQNHAATLKGQATFDKAKRNAIYRDVFDRVTRKTFLTVLTALPAVLIHDKKLVLRKGHMNPTGFMFNWMEWK